MPSLCNSTLSSSADQDECQYWSSFSEKPFCCGERLQVYKGKLNGKGPRGGDFSAVKVFVDRPGTEARCGQEVAKSRAASQWLARFLALTQYRPTQVRFTQLQMAPMDQVSMLNKLFAHNRRRPSSGEWILLEEMVHDRGTLLPFVDRHGKMYRETTPASKAACCSGLGGPHNNNNNGNNNNNNKTGWHGTESGSGSGSGRAWCSHRAPGLLSCSLNNRELLEAFVHFSFQASGGQLAVCCLEGVQDEQGRVLLKTPVIHSLQRGFGETDLGPAGLQAVIGRHVCNRHCRRFLSGRPRSASVPLAPHPHLHPNIHPESLPPLPTPPKTTTEKKPPSQRCFFLFCFFENLSTRP